MRLLIRARKQSSCASGTVLTAGPLVMFHLSWVAYAVSLGDGACAAGAGDAMATSNYQASFGTSWKDGLTGGFQHLEHVNVAIPTHAAAKQLYYDVLGCAPDKRRAQNIEIGSGTIWANIGTSQIHMPEGEAQVVPGTIGLAYADADELGARLEKAASGALGGTNFAWKRLEGDVIDVTCPYGNTLRIHHRKGTEPDTVPLDSRGGSLPNLSARSLGLGMLYVHFRVKTGTSGGIARFYRDIFGAEARAIATSTTARDSGSCSPAALDDDKGEAAGALVRVGPVQHLGFFESSEPLPEYDGHHVCVYLRDEDFRRSFIEADRRGLVFVNPRRNFGRADTLEKALDEKQYRIKNLVDPATGELLHVLEHEIRSVSHPSYPVGRQVA